MQSSDDSCIDNGLYLDSRYLPPELVALILSFLDADTLVFSCRPVCYVWKELINNYVWKLKMERERIRSTSSLTNSEKRKLRLPLEVYYSIFKSDSFEINLLKNNCGQDDYLHWIIPSLRIPDGYLAMVLDENFAIMNHNNYTDQVFVESYQDEVSESDDESDWKFELEVDEDDHPVQNSRQANKDDSCDIVAPADNDLLCREKSTDEDVAVSSRSLVDNEDKIENEDAPVQGDGDEDKDSDRVVENNGEIDEDRLLMEYLNLNDDVYTFDFDDYDDFDDYVDYVGGANDGHIYFENASLEHSDFKEHSVEWWKVMHHPQSAPWEIEDRPVGADYLPESDDFANCKSCFVTTNRLGVMYQHISFADFHISSRIMDEYRPAITVSEWYAGRYDCDSTYGLFVRLLDHEKKVIFVMDEIVKKHNAKAPNSTAWTKVSRTIENYPRGVRYLEFEHRGRDEPFWAGYYGSKMSGGVVSVRLPTTIYSSNDAATH